MSRPNDTKEPLVILDRIQLKDSGTIGILYYRSRPSFVTLELPWRHNQRNISCIPAGVYSCRRYFSQKYGQTFVVENVPNRSGIIFHAGNWTEDSRGCILVGSGFWPTSHKQPAISASKMAMKAFRELLKDEEEFTLSIESTFFG